MTEAEPHRSLQLEFSEPVAGMITVSLIGKSNETQRVSYELRTTGGSTSTHKGTTRLKADHVATLSTIRFSAGRGWCVSLTAQEERGESYTITRGSACANNADVARSY